MEGLSKQFFASRRYMPRKWKGVLPVRSLTGTLHGGGSYWAQRLKQSMLGALGYPSPPWWEDLPRIDPEAKLFPDKVLTEKV